MFGHFLDHQHRLEIAEAGAAELLRNGHAEHASGAQALDLVPRIRFAAVDLGGARRHMRFCERASSRLEFFLGGREFEIHRRFSRRGRTVIQPQGGCPRDNVTTNGVRPVADPHEKE